MTQSLTRRRLKSLAIGLVFLMPCPVPSCYSAEPSPARMTRTVKAIQAAQPAVVNIEGTKPAPRSGRYGETTQVNGMGAGVIIDASGYILTNQHVVEDVGRIEVTLHDGRKFRAQLIARDAETDLALIKIRSDQPLPEIPLGTSSDLMLGEPVIAIGNPFGYRHTVTEGIISALHRNIPVNGVQEYPDLIQTDASINPGNSGGPLLNADGLMIGINAAVRIGAQGIGFAIPADKAIEVAADMVHQLRHGQGDLFAVEADRDHGRSTVRVTESTSSEVQVGDIVHSISGRRVSNRLDYELAMLNAQSRKTLDLQIDRDDQLLTVKLPNREGRSGTVRLTSTGSSSQQVVRTLGVTLRPADPEKVRRIDSSYNGGMQVVAVTPGSLAARAQIRPGDILVGLLEWQTPNWDDLEWILDSAEWKRESSPKFHIIRGSEVFWGTLSR